MRSEKIGRLGEDLVCQALGYKRQPASGAVWPYKEDLIIDVEIGKHWFDGGTYEPVFVRHMAQVKTTTSRAFVDEFTKLQTHAMVENRTWHWFQVVLMPDKAIIYEVTQAAMVPLGPDAIGRERKNADQGRGQVGRQRRVGRSAPVRGRIRLQGRNGKPATYRRRAGVV